MGLSEGEESCLLLDEKLLRFMDQLELLQEKRNTLNSLIEQGWFSISKARYSMGNKQVSALQFANTMEPLVSVHVRTLDNDDVEFSTEKSPPEFSNGSVKEPILIEDIGPQEEGIRRRKKTKSDGTEKRESRGTGSEMDPEVNPVRKGGHNPHQDPLKWFGILVPQSLKQAQSSFKQVIELSAEIAALQIAVLNTRQELKHDLRNQESSDGAELNVSTGSKKEAEVPLTNKS
ncbi:PREDICTED: coiled-coil domain-containing protein 115 [Cyprinodon variegatus]|uniref:Vacuolar ATPase assembly protein VMA22 n=1 Tax=Cyprinodon variegatus TaxID=28743 RepID=A0A3Q2CWW2_CYPVA|nr:PREDICTED: coiled-coil domain-containing protein 115 [Cyprinodon variegatus]